MFIKFNITLEIVYKAGMEINFLTQLPSWATSFKDLGAIENI